MTRPTRRIVLIGLGPYARRIHYPQLVESCADYDIEIALLVELEDQRESVEEYLAAQPIHPKAIVYLPNDYRDGTRLHRDFLSAMKTIDLRSLWGIVVSTEPQAHKIYAQWALDNGLHVLLDKPVTASPLIDSPPSAALGLVDDFYDLLESATSTNALCLVQTQRRVHPGYELVRNLLADLIAEFAVPITYIDAYHADGMWNMPDEYRTRHNHPYRYGYGKLLHSGYHFLDLVTWLAALNDGLGSPADRLELTQRHHTPFDTMSQLGSQGYQALLPESGGFTEQFAPANLNRMKVYGETDVFLLGQYLRNKSVQTTISLNLLQSSFSRRAWAKLPTDTYKGNGRVRHERLTLQAGHLMSIQVHSYRSYQAADRDQGWRGPGGYDHFEVQVYRNSALIGGEPFARHDIGDVLADAQQSGEQGQFGSARRELLSDFLTADSRRAGLASHALPVKLTAAAYYAMRSAVAGRHRDVSIDLRADRENWLRSAA